MKKLFQKFYGSVLLVAVVGMFSVTGLKAQEAEQRVLLEQFTGAWCGWCVDGTIVMDSMMAEFPGKIIGVKVHSGDAMAFSQGNQLLSGLGVSSYPSGAVNRASVDVGGNIQIAISRGAWRNVAQQIMDRQPNVDVQLDYKIDKNSKTVKGMITGEFLNNVENNTRFLLYVIEDDVTGSGQGYDQSNYLSYQYNPTDDYVASNPYIDDPKEHPYYNKPGKIEGYVHEKVARAYIDGPFGAPNSIIGATNAGDVHRYTFSYTLDNSWDLNNVYLVGAVVDYAPNSLMVQNAAVGNSNETMEQIASISSTGGRYGAVASGESFQKTFTIENKSAASITVDLQSSLGSSTPGDWNVNIEEGNEITIDAGASKDVTVTLTAGPTRGIGEAILAAEVKGDAEALIIPNKTSFSAISSEIEKFNVFDGSSSQSRLTNILQSTDHTEYFDISASDYMDFASVIPNMKTIIWNSGDNGRINTTEENMLLSAVNNNKNVFIIGTIVPGNLSENSALLTKLGMRFVITCFQGQQTGRIQLSGVKDDPITDGFSNNGQLISYLTHALQTTGNNSYPIIKTVEDTVLAVRSELADSRAIVMSLSPQVISDPTLRNDFFDKAVKWLENIQPEPEAEISVNKNTVDFRTVYIGEYEDEVFQISNPGDIDLEVSELSISGSDNAFEVIDAPSGVITIEPGDKEAINVRFTPSEEKNYQEFLTIKSNAEDDISIELIGTGEAAGWVKDGVYGVDNVFTVNVGPNPFDDFTNINYTVRKAPQDIHLYIIDETGKTVQTVLNEMVAPGQYNVEFSAQNLTSGTYYLVARVNGKSEQIPLVLNK